ncbi:MAG TPA: PTS sugar transporter subunit IIC [Gemmatimonadaceae bacterium]|nr:PTS sugar transporter subunit IIC [Gemmatimonadaceae bacterium]
MIDILDLIPLMLLGAILGLDVVSFPQAMISRPLVAATLAGAVVGQPMSGLLIGAALELISLETLPIGASRYPEWGSAAVVGGAIFAIHEGAPAGAMAVAVVGALATGWIGGWTMVLLRRLNAVWARRHRQSLESGNYRTVVGLQIFGLTADLMRGAALTAIALVVLSPLSLAVVGLWGTDARIARAAVVGIAATVAVAAVWKLYHLTPGARWLFLGGLVVGMLLLVLT